VHSVYVALWGEVLVAGSVVAASTHFVGSSAVMFATMEHLVSASSTVGIASEIGGVVFALASTFGSSAVASKTGWAVRSEV
jgi:hypothetical protein